MFHPLSVVLVFNLICHISFNDTKVYVNTYSLLVLFFCLIASLGQNVPSELSTSKTGRKEVLNMSVCVKSTNL